MIHMKYLISGTKMEKDYGTLVANDPLNVNAPITIKDICFCRLLKSFKSLAQFVNVYKYMQQMT